jgi:hypothetical protein
MACLGGSLAPRSDCTLQLVECFGLSAGERGATREVWSKGNEALVFDAPKNVSGITASVRHGGYLGAVLRVLAARAYRCGAGVFSAVSISFIATLVAALGERPTRSYLASASGKFAAEHHHVPVLAIEDHGSRCGSAAPFCRISIEMLSGELTKAIRPSRGGRLIVRPASPKR